MALIDCPACDKKISSVAPICPQCGFQRGEATEEQLREFQRRRLRDRVYHLRMISYAVMSLFVAAFGWYWWASSGFQRQPTAGPLSLLAVGAVAYVVNRFLLFRARKTLRDFTR